MPNFTMIRGYELRTGYANSTPDAVIYEAGGEHTCALLASHEVRCWGRGSQGQLGHGSFESSERPVAVGWRDRNLTQVLQLSNGGLHSCALRSDSTVWCWGDNTHGQLGHGAQSGRTSPQELRWTRPIVAVSAGGSHTCAIDFEGSVWCWGWNRWGQLGDGSTKNSLRPVKVINVANATALSAGTLHTCAVINGSSTQCWGWGQWGQLGTGSGSSSTRPRAVQSVLLPDVHDVTAGHRHSCAVDYDSVVHCWGQGWKDNLVSGFHSGTLWSRTAPTAVVNLQQAVSASLWTTTPSPLLW